MSENVIFPGDVISSIEEYEAGRNTFDDGSMVRAATVGRKHIDKAARVASISHPKLSLCAQSGRCHRGDCGCSDVINDCNLP